MMCSRPLRRGSRGPFEPGVVNIWKRAMSCPETGTELGDARTSEPIHNAGDQPRASTFQQQYSVIARDTGTQPTPGATSLELLAGKAAAPLICTKTPLPLEREPQEPTIQDSHGLRPHAPTPRESQSRRRASANGHVHTVKGARGFEVGPHLSLQRTNACVLV